MQKRFRYESVFILLVLLALLVTTLAVPGRANAADGKNGGSPDGNNGENNACLKADAKGCSFGLPTFQYQTLLGQMLANPTPNVQPVAVDMTEIGRIDNYRIVGGIAPLYDAPNGNPVGAIRDDFQSFPVGKREGDWVQVGVKRWMKAEDLTNAESSTFSGVLFNGSQPFPMAWILFPTRPSSIPGVAPADSSPMLERYHRVNIFATVKIDDWEWYLVGPGQWIEERRVARVQSTPRPNGVKGHWIAVDLYQQVLVAYEDDQMVFATMVSTGMPKPGFGTNKGLFRIWSRLRSDLMSGGMGGPDAYSLPDVPYVMYFDDSISLHGAYWHDGFGYRHSHGCVNMSVTDAHWVFDWTNGFYGDTWVYVYNSKNYIKSMPSQA